MELIPSRSARCVEILVLAPIFPLQPNQMPDFCLSAALTATSSPPARAFAFLSGIATLLETMTSCGNSGALRDTDRPLLSGPANNASSELALMPAALSSQYSVHGLSRVPNIEGRG